MGSGQWRGGRQGRQGRGGSWGSRVGKTLGFSLFLRSIIARLSKTYTCSEWGMDGLGLRIDFIFRHRREN